MSLPRLALLAILALALAGCSSSTPLAVVASSPNTIGVGEQRVLISLVDVETNEFLASEDREATVLLRDEDGTPLGTYDLDFVWTLPEVRGIYEAYVDIPAAGVYQVTVSADGLDETAPSGFIAVEDPSVVAPGEPAPASVTRTADDVDDLGLITSDPDPDPEMYSLTVADAVTNGTPAVIVFATPAFCETQACGPMLDQVKTMRSDFDGVDFVHVEVYEDLQVETASELTIVPSIEEWGLPSEPWIFVTDRTGTVTASFEGAVSNDRLAAAVARAGG